MFYPQEQDAQGASLMAEPGMVIDFNDLPPSDGQWVADKEDDEDDTPPGDDEPAPADPIVPDEQTAAPDAGQAILASVELKPEPKPEPVPVPIPKPTPAPIPEPEPDPKPAAKAAAPQRFGYVTPYART